MFHFTIAAETLQVSVCVPSEEHHPLKNALGRQIFFKPMMSSEILSSPLLLYQQRYQNPIWMVKQNITKKREKKSGPTGKNHRNRKASIIQIFL